MCGILGGFGAQGLNGGDISAALDSIKHRGPDDSGVEIFGSAFVGMRRLAIIDTAGGHQPLANEDGSVWVVMNGEIYNYLELMADLKAKGHQFKTQSDTEVLVHLYEELGENLVDKLRGMFAFCIFDKRSRRMLLGRDRFGKKPLYYTVSKNSGAFFASELKALRSLMKSSGIGSQIRPQAIYDFLSLGAVPQPETAFEGVYCLPKASTIWIERANPRPREYWRLGTELSLQLSDDEIGERLRHEIREAVRIRLRSDVPLGVLLSGGLDSSIIALEASRELGDSLETFTVSTGDKDLDESEIAGRTASFLGVRNTSLRMEGDPVEAILFLSRHYDQPFADPSAIPTYAICRLARKHVKVILTGDGGDEIFGGYLRYLAAMMAQPFAGFPRLGARLLASLVSFASTKRRSSFGLLQRYLRGLSADPSERYLIWTTDMLRESDKRSAWVAKPVRPTEEFIRTQLPKTDSIVEQIMGGDRNLNLVNNLLVKMDMASMAASIEARSPFLDHCLAEFASKIDVRRFFSKGNTKALLRSAYKDLLPAEVISAPKKGFEIPLESWLKSDLKELLNDNLGSSNPKVAGYLDQKFIKALLNGTRACDRNRAFLLYAVLVLELWLKGEAESSNF